MTHRLSKMFKPRKYQHFGKVKNNCSSKNGKDLMWTCTLFAKGLVFWNQEFRMPTLSFKIHNALQWKCLKELPPSVIQHHFHNDATDEVPITWYFPSKRAHQFSEIEKFDPLLNRVNRIFAFILRVLIKRHRHKQLTPQFIWDYLSDWSQNQLITLFFVEISTCFPSENCFHVKELSIGYPCQRNWHFSLWDVIRACWFRMSQGKLKKDLSIEPR